MQLGEYEFRGGYPTPETIQQAYDDSDSSRAIEAYKFFFPTVSAAAIWKGSLHSGTVPNQVFSLLRGNPKQLVLTPNSDTPYAAAPLDLSVGPMVVEVPAGPLICVVNDLNQRYVMDLGLPGPDAGKGGRHLILPPLYAEAPPSGYHTGRASTNRVLLMLRALPLQGDLDAADERIKSVKVYPLEALPGWIDPTWLPTPDRPEDFTPLRWERRLDYWRVLHEVIDTEPPFEPYRMNYGQLAALGIEKGKPFAPGTRMKGILEQAARAANAQMRVQSFADRSPERLAWPDRQWEWASLRSENGTFDLPSHRDLVAREKWFYQAVIESPAMFRRGAGAGSLYWLGVRDGAGHYLDGGKTYRLRVPLPVPAQLFWSVTVYDPLTRSEIQTDQGKAALRSLMELSDAVGSSIDLYFGPRAPIGQVNRWIQTQPGKGWFSYFRIYGPDRAAFDGSWRPADLEEIG